MRLKHHTIIIHPGVPARLLSNRNLFINISTHRQYFLKARAQAQHLEATTVGKGRTTPVHKLTQVPSLLYQLVPWLQVEVIGISQNSLCTHASYHLGHHCFHVCFCAHHNEGWRLDITMWSVNHTCPCQRLRHAVSNGK